MKVDDADDDYAADILMKVDDDGNEDDNDGDRDDDSS